MKNIIRKQSVRFQYNGKSDGFALQKEVSDWCTHILIPQIEQQLEPFCLLDEYISLDKVEINTETGDADWKQKIQQEILFSLKRNLRNSANAIHAELVSKQEDASFHNQTNKNDTIARKSDELFIYFFSTGYLPWWSNAVITTDFKLTLQNWVKENKEDARIETCKQQLRQLLSESLVSRILNHLPGQLFFEFLKNIFKRNIDPISQVEIFLKKVLADEISEAKQRILVQPVYRFILTALLSNKEEINVGVMMQLLYAELQKQKKINLSAKLLSAAQSNASNPLEIVWQQVIRQNQMKSGEKNSAGIGKKQTEENKDIVKSNKIIDRIKGRPDELRKRVGTAKDLLEGIFIDNAGAVIVAAFLPRLFEKLKIVKDNSIVSNDMAALIIQYIISGKTEISEFELVLPKILCGMELEQPVNTNKKITAGQKKEADQMLLSVIEHWAVLKNTSVQGLREAFLQRSGKLIMIDNEWLLQVERKSFDMLLQQLPWSFTMLKLPWMKHLLKTDWV